MVLKNFFFYLCPYLECGGSQSFVIFKYEVLWINFIMPEGLFHHFGNLTRIQKKRTFIYDLSFKIEEPEEHVYFKKLMRNSCCAHTCWLFTYLKIITSILLNFILYTCFEYKSTHPQLLSPLIHGWKKNNKLWLK